MIIPAPAVLEARPGAPVPLPDALACGRHDAPPERYRLEIGADGIAFSASDVAGEERDAAPARRDGWSGTRGWDDFRGRLAAHGPVLDALGVKFHRSKQTAW